MGGNLYRLNEGFLCGPISFGDVIEALPTDQKDVVLFERRVKRAGLKRACYIMPRDMAEKTQVYFSLYFAMTGMHALHMIIGISILLVLVVRAWGGAYTGGHIKTRWNDRELILNTIKPAAPNAVNQSAARRI